MSRIAEQCLIAWNELDTSQQQNLSKQLKNHILNGEVFPTIDSKRQFLATLYYCYQSPFSQNQRNMEQQGRLDKIYTKLAPQLSNLELDIFGKRLQHSG